MTILRTDLTAANRHDNATSLANLITHTRTPIALLGVMCGLYGWSTHIPWPAEVGLGLLIISALTDTFDGWIARNYSGVSEFGGLLDTVHDKNFLVVVVSSCLLPLTLTNPGHACLLVVFLAVNVWRDNYVMALRCLGAAKGLSSHAQWFGKARTISLMIFSCFLFTCTFNSRLISFLPAAMCWPVCYLMESFTIGLTFITWYAYVKFYNN